MLKKIPGDKSMQVSRMRINEFGEFYRREKSPTCFTLVRLMMLTNKLIDILGDLDCDCMAPEGMCSACNAQRSFGDLW